MKLQRRFVIAGLLVLAATVHAQPSLLPDRARAAADAITAAQLVKDLEFLASDELMGRNTPSPGFDKAAAYIVARLQRGGLKPLGDDGTFLQHYVMRESSVDTTSAYVEIGGRRFRFGEGFVLRSFAGPVSGSYDAIYVGHGWTIPDQSIDPYAGFDLTGKIVVAHGPRALPKGVALRQIGRVTPGARNPLEEAQRRGAAAVLFIPLTAALENWESLGDANLSRRELEPSVPSAYAAARITSLLLSREATEEIQKKHTGGLDLIARGDASDYPASFQFDGKISVHVPVASAIDHRPYNVVALLEGSDPALRNEYVTVESHLDGAVGTRPLDGDAIYNSADDNATGSAATLAIAEQMATAPPRRSVIFIWDSGEEQGLWGTRYFVANPPVPLDGIVAHFNIDMIGATRAPGSPDAESEEVTGPNEVYLVGPGVLSDRVKALLDRVNAGYLGMTFNRALDRADNQFFYPRTDAGPFLERGILTIGFFTGIHPRYHGPADEARYLDPHKLAAVARTAFASIWALASASERPGIDKPIPASVPRYR